MKIVLVQFKIEWENPEANRLKVESLLEGVDRQVDLIVLPEMFNTGFTMNSAEMAEEMDGISVEWMKNLSYRYDAGVVASLIIKDKDQFFNRLIFVKPGGDISWYDKVHLFGIGGESSGFSKGNSQLIERFRDVNISFQICYDLRFPVWSRNVDNGYDLLINIANWPESRKRVWKTLLAARAIENQCYVVGVNRVGLDGNGIFYSGDSRIIDPRGEVIDSLKHFKEDISVVEISMNDLSEFRDKFPVWKDADKFSLGSAL